MKNTSATNTDLDQENRPGELPTDDICVRQITPGDLERITRIDEQAMGRSRQAYYAAKLDRALNESQLVVSLAAEVDGHVVGFVLAQLHYGEFGQTEPTAVIDSIGVDPRFRGKHVGQALMRQLLMNLRALNVDHVETQVEWSHFDLLRFLQGQGFAPSHRISLVLNL